MTSDYWVFTSVSVPFAERAAELPVWQRPLGLKIPDQMLVDSPKRIVALFQSAHHERAFERRDDQRGDGFGSTSGRTSPRAAASATAACISATQARNALLARARSYRVAAVRFDGSAQLLAIDDRDEFAGS